ncbi:putative transcriptional regulator arsE family protein [Haloplasma contractile SSD-17B]|uniref:Transcriptional regulator arsE family protein n=2 Tax=Haloplasma TaxID=471824 RepID=U2DUJ8_9MOLU|nr:putative transcriptional regulator arsE family protein [Haloplasma contractile SSD-17B]
MQEKNQGHCEVKCIHEDTIEDVRTKLPEEVKIFELAEFFKTFADSTRIKIISALSNAEMCVCDLAHLLNTSQSAISHQLRVLRQNRLVKYRKVGKIVYYSLDDDHVLEVMRQGMEHISHG